MPKLELDITSLNKFLNGMMITKKNKDGLYNIYSEKYIGVGIIKNNKLKRDIVVN